MGNPSLYLLLYGYRVGGALGSFKAHHLGPAYLINPSSYHFYVIDLYVDRY